MGNNMLRIERISIRVPIFPKLVSRFNEILIKILGRVCAHVCVCVSVHVWTDMFILKLKWKYKRKIKTILNNNKTEELQLAGSKNYYKAAEIMTVRYLCKDKQRDEWKGIEGPDPHMYGH